MQEETCDYWHWDWSYQSRIELRWASNGLSFSAAEKQLIRDSVAAFNALPNARIHIAEGTSSCVGRQFVDTSVEQPHGTICLMKEDRTTKTATAWPHVVVPGCVANFCEIAFGDELFLPMDEDQVWRFAQHELGHCFGLHHPAWSGDWMSANMPANPGTTQQHVAMTRDTMNGLSYLHPFGSNFLFDIFKYMTRADVLVRYSKNHSNTIPWYLSGSGTSRGLHVFFDEGEVSDDGDFGNEETLAYLTGDFAGDGPPHDVAAAMCTNCNAGDNAGDTVTWWVMEGGSWVTVYFDSSSSWIPDFGDGEDYDQYRAGDFDGNGCDDLWLIRNQSARESAANGGMTCDGAFHDPLQPADCRVRVYIARARNGAGYTGTCDRFESASAEWVVLEMGVNDRSAASAWPWVVGDFVTTPDSVGCDDLAYGRPSQTNPRQLSWMMIRSTDTDMDGDCDTLVPMSNPWYTDWGDLGMHQYYAADAGNPSGSGEDLIRVRMAVSTSPVAQWGIAYSNGSNGFTNPHYPVANGYISGGEDYWTGMVFGIGDFDGANGVDLISLRGEYAGPVRYFIAFRSNTGGQWSYASSLSGNLPTAQASWDQVTDNDDDAARDNGGDDAKHRWWYQWSDVWSN